jgi:ACS family tartrate transporter-like MFS transporter
MSKETLVSPTTANSSTLERSTLRTAMVRLLPFLLICYAIAFIDRTNISVASLQMNPDLGISDAAYGLGAGVFFLTYTLLEVPSNRILARVGARWWIARIMVSWGIVTILMAFVVDEWTFYLGRLLLGACEAGFYPGVIYFLTRWFPRAARGRAFSLFQIGGPIALMIGSPLAGSLLELDGNLGLAGWQWVFIVTGVPAIVAGLIVFVYLVDSPKSAKWLSAEQQNWLTATLAEEGDDGSHANGSMKGAFRSKIVWMTCAVNFFIIMSLYGVSMWLPRTIQSLTAADNLTVSFMSAIPYVGAVIATVVMSRIGDRTGRPHRITLVATLVGGLGLIVAAATSQAPVLSLIGICIASAGIYAAIPSMWSMSTARMPVMLAATSIGFISAIGNVGGFVGPYVGGLANTATGTPAATLVIMGVSLVVAAAFTVAASRTKTVVTRETASAAAPAAPVVIH